MLAKIHSLILILATALLSYGQSSFYLEYAEAYFNANKQEWGLSEINFHQLKLKNFVQDQHNGAAHLYFIQTYQGLELMNTHFAVHFSKDGEVVFTNQQLKSILSQRINPTFLINNKTHLLTKVGQYLNLPVNKEMLRFEQRAKNKWTVAGGNMAKQPIHLSKVLLPDDNGKIIPCWQVAIEPIGGSDFWNLYLDAKDGTVIQKNSWTVHCQPQIPKPQHVSNKTIFKDFPLKSNYTDNSIKLNTHANTLLDSNDLTTTPKYMVFPLPIENPLLGNRELVPMPINEASPFGWHDVDGISGHDYFETKGNNVHAFLDRDANDEPDDLKVVGDEALTFDFPFSMDMEPHTIQEAAVTQLFYVNNYLHDFSYQYGFDEAAGNFQENNYEKGGMENDPIMANAQDGSGYNNANFSSPPDGMRARMQMYLWGNRTSKMLTINSPSGISGSYTASMASFGQEVRREPVSGQIVLVQDTSSHPTLGCTQYMDPNHVRGKIAMIDRGECEFGEKAYKAQLRGAIAVIIVNYEDRLLSMSPGVYGSNVDIPVVIITQSDGEKIKNQLQNGVEASLQLTGDEDILYDSDFDNGIIVHEYAHGISIRLTGGASNSNCLINDEQMGEGWSDFFALALTSPVQDGIFPRSIGAFLTKEPAFGKGIRRQKYSTDFNINSQTFYDIQGTTSPHQLGEVWTSILWDLYWAFSDKYGYDPDLIHGSGGNNKAIQLIIDGMKLQNCNPGLLDARDAIIAADILNNNGANECLIWEVFTRRGLGWDAQQGNSSNRHDGKAGFQNKPECIPTLKIKKTIDLEASQGNTVMVNITVANHKGFEAKDLNIIEEIPFGASYIGSSARGTDMITFEKEKLLFEIPNLPHGGKINLKYELTIDPVASSRLLFRDDAEGFFPLWESISLEGKEAWYKTNTSPKSGLKAWRMVNLARSNDQVLQLKEPINIEGEQPILRFFHQYATEPYFDGGRLEISLDGVQWEVLDQEIIKGAYSGKINPNLFEDLSDFGYQGEKRTYEEVRIDLSAYRNQSAFIRFRFGSDESQSVAPDSTFGWIIDDIEIFDAFFLQSTACIYQSESEPICTTFPYGGTLVQPGTTTNTNELLSVKENWSVYPNPTSDRMTVKLQLFNQDQWQLEILTADGISIKKSKGNGAFRENIDVSSYPAGVYLVQLITSNGSFTKKLLKY